MGNNNLTVGRIDLAPFRRFGVGFDRMFEEMERLSNLTSSANNGYPPFNLERISDEAYRITLAVAGFAESEIDVTVKENTLTIVGKKADSEEAAREFLHKGIANRSFERNFVLSERIVVKQASLADGMLVIDLEHVVPEELKARKIPLIKG
jgi:molecular chaperone IbpA